MTVSVTVTPQSVSVTATATGVKSWMFVDARPKSNAAFSCGGIDGKLGGLTPMNSYVRLVCIRGIKTAVIGLRGNPATAHCCVILKRYNVILPQIVFLSGFVVSIRRTLHRIISIDMK